MHATPETGNFLIDSNGHMIEKGAVVRFDEGWCRVSAVFPGKKTVNLCGIFSGRSLHKKVSIETINEDHDEWYQHWTQSETYRCM